MDFFNHDTITVFNAFVNPETGVDEWHSTVIDGVNLVVTKGANITESGLNDTDGAKVFIPESKLDNYVKPKEWEQLTDKSQKFTFNPAKDFFVEGAISDYFITGYEFAVYQRAKELFDNVFKVTTVDKYEDVLPKLVVGGA